MENKYRYRYIEIGAVSDNIWCVYERHAKNKLDNERILLSFSGEKLERFIFDGVFEVDSDYSIINENKKIIGFGYRDLIIDKQQQIDLFNKLSKYKLINIIEKIPEVGMRGFIITSINSVITIVKVSDSKETVLVRINKVKSFEDKYKDKYKDDEYEKYLNVGGNDLIILKNKFDKKYDNEKENKFHKKGDRWLNDYGGELYLLGWEEWIYSML